MRDKILLGPSRTQILSWESLKWEGRKGVSAFTFFLSLPPSLPHFFLQQFIEHFPFARVG